MATPKILDVYNFEANAPIVASTLQEVFPRSHIITEKGYQGKVRLKLVGPEFNELNEAEKQKKVWDAIHDQFGPGAQAISFAVVYGDDEL